MVPEHPWLNIDLPRFLGCIAVTESAAFLVVYPFWHYKTLCQLPGNVQSRLIADRKSFRLPAFYRGCSTAIIGFFPGNAAYLTTYECVRHHSGLTGVSANFTGGFVAELVYLALALPVENVVVRMMADERKRKWHNIASEIYQGRSWYRGTKATVMTSLPASCMWWPLYETFKSSLGEKAPTLPYYFTAGASSLGASFITTIALHPIDTAKARMQSGIGTYGEKDGSVFRLLRSMTHSEGYRACFRGLLPRLLLSQCEGLLWGASYELIIMLSRRTKLEETV
eukprot:GEMP01087472.1.p1 GENE.GEMP01087472.1~~GEMP01087472.1.p1  ORF type:complete len:282 (+),score=40.50 GEMP01087472.1:84-929(+)